MTPNVTAGTNPSKLFDLSMIENFCRGNQEQVKKMIKVFISQVPQSVEAIKLAYSKHNFSTIKNEAHRIKPILSYYAVLTVEHDIKQIESLAASEATGNELESKINNLDEVVTKIVDELKTY
ncbi:MAG: Hpt domain-containing protein [Bacteroidetes bacterium]|nr:Hpt domain-containing protein [Bacteroidota bacterium]